MDLTRGTMGLGWGRAGEQGIGLTGVGLAPRGCDDRTVARTGLDCRCDRFVSEFMAGAVPPVEKRLGTSANSIFEARQTMSPKMRALFRVPYPFQTIGLRMTR